MSTIFVNLKSELTVAQNVLEAVDFNVYRTRTGCGCVDFDNRRDALIAIHEYDWVQVKVIRCKACAKEGGQQ